MLVTTAISAVLPRVSNSRYLRRLPVPFHKLERPYIKTLRYWNVPYNPQKKPSDLATAQTRPTSKANAPGPWKLPPKSYRNERQKQSPLAKLTFALARSAPAVCEADGINHRAETNMSDECQLDPVVLAIKSNVSRFLRRERRRHNFSSVQERGLRDRGLARVIAALPSLQIFLRS